MPSASSASERVLATLAEIEQVSGPRLEIELIRAQLVGPDRAAEVTQDMLARFPDALATRVAAARIALGHQDPAAQRAALVGLAGEGGAVAWALRGRWQCGHCAARPAAFSWRCGNCRRWGTLVMETGVEPAALPPRERRTQARQPRPDALLGAQPDAAPALELAADDDLGHIGAAPSVLGRVGGWMSNVWRRGAR